MLLKRGVHRFPSTTALLSIVGEATYHSPAFNSGGGDLSQPALLLIVGEATYHFHYKSKMGVEQSHSSTRVVAFPATLNMCIYICVHKLADVIKYG